MATFSDLRRETMKVPEKPPFRGMIPAVPAPSRGAAAPYCCGGVWIVSSAWSAVVIAHTVAGFAITTAAPSLR